MNHSLASVFAMVLIFGCYEILASQKNITACDFQSLKLYGIGSEFKNFYFGWKTIKENFGSFNDFTYDVYSLTFGVERKKLINLEWLQVQVGGLEEDGNKLRLAPYIIPSNRTYSVLHIPGNNLGKEEKLCDNQYMYKTIISAMYTFDVQENEPETELSGLLKLTCKDGKHNGPERKIKSSARNWDMDVESPTIGIAIYDTERGEVVASIKVKQEYLQSTNRMLFTRIVSPLVKSTSRGVRAVIQTYNKLLSSITPGHLNITIEKEKKFQMDFVRTMQKTKEGKRDLHFMFEKEEYGENYSYKLVSFVCEQPDGTDKDEQVKCSKPDAKVITFTVPNTQDSSPEE